ncbi:sensor histidine kinase [Bacillus solimangrovi]|uniref:histidine kinase n=1 Tax=Bacillus solimangrovi TaxID=1305675 RepID=A0A1E5LJW7_9BACI|nr:HAMP domain-containing sensor histidine kinase [Bacillus solimangrovi]OEH94318.1 hypothetical protein BFG57_08665 [Bacillus solimangrovi]
MTGINRRIILHYMFVILLTIVIIEVIFISSISKYYNEGVTETLVNHANVSTSFTEEYMTLTRHDFKSQIPWIRESLKYPNTEMQIISLNGEVLSTSTGITNEEIITTPDIKEAISGEISIHKGILNEESILAVSAPLPSKESQVVGVIRFVTSLERVEDKIQSTALFSISIGLAVMLVVFIISLRLARSIAKPLQEITRTSEKMARGRFDIELNETYIDEIGTLAKTLNHMAREIQQTDKMKNEFISSISHELRTPLTSIKGWSETILTGDMREINETKQGLTIISKETDRLITLVEELLDFSRFESNQLKLTLNAVSISELVNDVVTQMKLKASQHYISIIFTKEQEHIINADENRLKQVFINIIDNAIKYSPPHTQIDISMNVDNHNNSIITISDKGIGISEEAISNVTKMFYQVDHQKDGTGLGLAICKKIIDLHKGELNIKSSSQSGTTVTIKLPHDPTLMTK